MIEVSIIICAFNGGKYIDRAIRSCLNQILINAVVEVVVVNDGSTDNTRKVCESFGENIRLINLDKNIGVAAASNIGIENAKYDFVMRVDCDDFINQLTIMSMAPILEYNPELAFIVCDHVRVDNDGQKQERIKLDNLRNIYRHGAGVLFRKNIISQVGGYDEELRNCEDFDLLARLIVIEGKEFARHPVPLYRYYMHGENLTSNNDRTQLWVEVANKYGINYGEN